MRNAAIIVAGGRGVRASGPGGTPKQYLYLAGKTVLERSLAAFLDHQAIEFVQPVIPADDEAAYEEAVAGLSSPKLLKPVSGGQTRQRSVLAGLRALQAHSPYNVLIHDAARPFISQAVISRVIDSLKENTACLAALPVSDTLKAEEAGRVVRTVSREGLWRAQTPQAFSLALLRRAHQQAAAEGYRATDDAMLVERLGRPVKMVLGSRMNIKITTPEDLALAEAFVAMETRRI